MTASPTQRVWKAGGNEGAVARVCGVVNSATGRLLEMVSATLGGGGRGPILNRSVWVDGLLDHFGMWAGSSWCALLPPKLVSWQEFESWERGPISCHVPLCLGRYTTDAVVAERILGEISQVGGSRAGRTLRGSHPSRPLRPVGPTDVGHVAGFSS